MNLLTSVPKTLKITLGALIMLLCSVAFANSVSAHGYVNNPESRNLLCADGANYDCGAVIYEPQSLEAPGNYPEGGPPDGKIASANIFHELDAQSEDRWAKVPMSSGAFTFEWTLTAAHATDKWEYYITKEDWDPNDPLERSDFERFCSIDDNGDRPPFTVNHDCVIPDRTGYHVILAYWEVADTANAFYNVIDANFDGEYVEPGDPGTGEPDPGEPSDAPAWDANETYLGGDQVTYNGNIYEAKWWTQGETPGEAEVWELVSEGTASSNNTSYLTYFYSLGTILK
ncbi:lytic polysaccharide monooxygenase [Virgibacillus salexigens]|uniref:lytic polysaccharide monooxygenase n=1 Tax=Virgibacillus TaxID=84406 RepID=UPI00137006D2|nr:MULTISPECIES: lytic polysaccharide monooxygenase [Virgibacillus]MYL40690.1 chitin-binding protein [Virgibacillus massiliensis]